MERKNARLLKNLKTFLRIVNHVFGNVSFPRSKKAVDRIDLEPVPKLKTIAEICGHSDKIGRLAEKL
ncbi:hypothetical protein LEP1GSC060_1285 [Leptospira weilii serovar Ranarum str. ICFT]|uniref:Uncharacterized protein n=1 Tax=Leptospira weilii serovar Ranarum str. ICFT TaxID=1218598 RepID=N1WR73_9LEPT|nr:hypothetical protein LEP1GSC060_1285 [Leptospira weilii serovar Ranarum str. ICFT]